MVQVYGIECSLTKFVYVGCTKYKLAKRMREHRCLLNQRKHACPKMIEDWHRYGGETFTIRVLEALDRPTVEEKRAAETKWMNFYKAIGLLYNENLASFAPVEGAIAKAVAVAHLKPGNRWTPEANEKRRLAQLGKPKNHGAKVSATKKALGQRPSLEAASRGGKRAAELGIPSIAAKIGQAKRRAAKGL